MKNDPRKITIELVTKNLIGPANDTFIDNGEKELVTDYPLSKYYSGIIFPNLGGSKPHDIDKVEQQSSFLDEDEIVPEAVDLPVESTDDIDLPSVNSEDVGNDDFLRSELFPYSFGLSFCLTKDAHSFIVRISYGRYRQVDPTVEAHPDYRLKLDIADYDLIKMLSAGNGKYLYDTLGYDTDKGSIFLKRKLVGNSVGVASGDFADLREIKRIVFQRLNESRGSEKDRYSKLNAVLRNITPLYKKAWIRTPCMFESEIILDSLIKDNKLSFCSLKTDDSNFECTLHTLLIDQKKDYLVIKVLVENSTTYTLTDQIIADRPALNCICMFQSNIRIESEFIRPLPQAPSPSYAGIEDKIIDCQYRSSHVYALAHNCSCSWQDMPPAVFTEFIPTVVPPVTVNRRFDESEGCLDIRDNSCFGDKTDREIVDNLLRFADMYWHWIQGQEELVVKIDERHSDAAARIIAGQNDTLERMRSGIMILESKPEIMMLYKLANSTMLVNMAHSLKKINHIDYQKASGINYHPFQLAFLLINIECVVNPESDIRKTSIDLLWFPTGGGKTEAYFLLSAFSLLFRRFFYREEGFGTSVIMRYTLRLLTAQQFERASRMILSLNYVCSLYMPSLIESQMFTIGLWIGAASSPNKLNEGENSAYEIIEKIIDASDKEEALRANKFPLSDCPWCGSSLIEFGKTGFTSLKNRLIIRCLNPDCHFHKELPIDLVDESLYNNAPSLLFATVDKFIRLAWVAESAAFFGSNKGNLPPDLIIQDELHLISGPLGSITALFEGIIEMLCRRGGRMPRIIASTATIKNSTAQVKGLFGNRQVVTFPPPGIDYEDNFFATIKHNDLNREYVGIYPTGKTFTTSQIRLLALLLWGRWELKSNIAGSIDDYWTIVSYYNSLRELGRMYSKHRDEVQSAYSQIIMNKNSYCRKQWLSSPKELTSRISGYEVKDVLHSLEATNIDESDFDGSVRNATDVVFATNMISVGLDIDRLNTIVVNGQPKSISEYIQVTSRIARKHPGLVFAIFNPFKVRDKSHYENFSSFHNNYYRYVEPISVTPYTRVAIRKLMPTLLAAYLRLVKGISMPKQAMNTDIDEYATFMADRMEDAEMHHFLLTKVTEHMAFLKERLSQDPELTFDNLLIRASDAAAIDYEEGDWLTMNSMREISPNSVIKLTTHKPKKRNSDYE